MKTFRVLLFAMMLCALLLPLVSCGGDDDDNDDAAPTDDDANVDDDVADDDVVDDDVIDDDTSDDDTGDDDTGDDDTGDDDTTTYLIPAGVIYTVQGNDSRYGAYEGFVEIRDDDESPNFIRTIRFDTLSFPDPRKDIDYEVHTAWTGEVDRESGGISISLQVADFIKQYEDLERTDIDRVPVVVAGAASTGGKDGFIVQYNTPEDGFYYLEANETWTYQGESAADPIFLNEDEQIASHEPMPEGIHDLIFLLLSGYHALEFYDDYRDREDFQAGVHYVSHYRTDFAWYRANPEGLRVPNKWLDKISMAEAMLRARGFAPTLGEKAAWFDEEMPVYYLNSLGMFSSARYDSEPLEQDESYDGLLWTGCYLASQVFRYLVTGEQEALDNWLFALDSLILSHDIVQDDASFGRAVRPHVADGNKEWIQGEPPYEEYDWMCCGNNDMIQGLYYGYTLSWIYLPEDELYDEYRDKIAERAARLADFCTVANDGEFNEIKANWLAWMTTGEETYRDRYQELYANPLLRAYTNLLGGGMFYLWGISDWSGQHLDAIGQLALWFLATETGDTESVELIDSGWVNGLRLNSMTQTLWPIVAYSLADPPPSLDDVFDNAIWNMREIPYPKQRLEIDKRIDPAWSASPLPSLFWKFDWMQGGRHQGLYGVPMYTRNMHPNMWVPAPFDFQVGETDWTEGGGADFLHAYWLGRYFGTIEEDM